jgi:sRNA-binding carbon storage regulator CsrA
VYRAEVYKRIQDENRRAAATVVPDLQAMAAIFRKLEEE